MKIDRSSKLFALLLATMLALGPIARAQEAISAATEKKAEEPKAAPADPKAGDTTAAGQPSEEKKDDEPAAKPEDDDKAGSVVEQKAAEGMEKLQKKTDEISDKIIEKAEEKSRQAQEKAQKARARHEEQKHRHHGEEPPFGDHVVSTGVKGDEAVSVFGSSTVDGDVDGDAVSVFGSTTVNGSATGDAVSVFGTTTVNGHVGGGAVAVFGDIVLGPKAEVDGDVSVAFGRIVRDPAALVHGQVIVAVGAVGGLNDFHWLHAYMNKCVRWGRPLWVGEDLGWAWLVAGGFLLFYVLLALLFPAAIERSVETLEQRPGGTVLTAFLTLLLTPFLIILLCVTVIGIPLVPVLLLALFIGSLFGKAAVHAWLGRRLSQVFGLAVPTVVMSVVLGGIFVTILYLVPFLGFLLWKIFGSLGLGMVVYRVLLSMQRQKPAPVTVAAAVPAVDAAAAAGTAGVPPVVGEVPAPTQATVLPPIISAATLPRAGFWIRIAACLLDGVMVGIMFGMLHRLFFGFGGIFPFWFAVYCVVMWATKATTIGGIICGLKIVRLDDRRVDWGVAIVRALGGFLSLAVAGLGFIWVAFDHDHQSWHDKIAGTTIVRVPKGTALL